MEDDFRRLVAALPGLIWTAAADGYADFVNRTFCDYTGLAVEAALGEGWHAVLHVEDRPFVLERWPHAAKPGEVFEMEARLRRFDGVYRWFVVRARPLEDGSGAVKCCAIASDIDGRKQVEQALRGLKLDLSELCESIPGLVCTLSPAGKVELFNRELLDFFGKTGEELRRWGTIDAVHPDDLPGVIAAHTEAVLTETPYLIEHRCRRADGVYRWFLVRGLPVRQAGVVVSWFVLLTDVEDRKRAEQALVASERNLSLIINTIPAPAWSALPDGSTDFLNQQYLELVGMTLEQARGSGWSAAVHPDDLAALAAKWQAILASEQPGEAEARLRRTDGEYRWFLFRVNPLRDETGRIVKWYGTNTDIEDRKNAEDELRRNQLFLAEGQRINRTGTFLWRLDPDEFTFSAELYRIFDFDPNEPLTLAKIVGRVHPEDVPLVAEKVALARSGVTDHEYECRLRMPDGSTRHLRTNAFGSRNREGRLEYIGGMQDVTDRRRAEEALGKVRSELAHMTRVASLGALTASIAHEVNQPLAGIITNANTCLRMLAADPPNVQGARETARRTIRDGNRASEVITRLRALFAKNQGARELVDLNEATREVLALSRSELQRARVVLRTELADALPAVLADRVQLQQVILNLVLNASAAMSGVGERPRELTIRTERANEADVRLTVRDTGTGLEPQALERLFEPFYTTKDDGMGLGLYVCRSIIESHDGRLWATPNPGPGATFSFSIPRVGPTSGVSTAAASG
jgi:PAS domain S-box-containing protein